MFLYPRSTLVSLIFIKQIYLGVWGLYHTLIILAIWLVDGLHISTDSISASISDSISKYGIAHVTAQQTCSGTLIIFCPVLISLEHRWSVQILIPGEFKRKSGNNDFFLKYSNAFYNVVVIAFL